MPEDYDASPEARKKQEEASNGFLVERARDGGKAKAEHARQRSHQGQKAAITRWEKTKGITTTERPLIIPEFYRYKHEQALRQEITQSIRSENPEATEDSIIAMTNKKIETLQKQEQEAQAETLKQQYIERAANIIEKHPKATLAAALIAGYFYFKDPKKIESLLPKRKPKYPQWQMPGPLV